MRSISVSLLALFVVSPLLHAQSRDAVVDQTIATLERVREFDEVALSPDATRAAWVMTARAKGGLRTAESGLFAGPVASGGAGNRVTAAAPARKKGAATVQVPSEWAPAWSPDGREIAFLSDARGGRVQLYVARADGTDVRALTAVTGALAMPRWSPDGRSVAFLFIENASRKGGALEAMTPPSGDVDEQVEEQRLAVVDLATKALQFVSPAKMYVYDYDWTPDGKSLVGEAVNGSGENNYWVAKLYRFGRAGGEAGLLYEPTLQIANPRCSPDGKSIAFIEGLMSDEGNSGGDVFVIPADGGAATNLTSGIHATPASLEWLPDSRSILVGENVNGRSGLARVPVTGGAAEELWSGEEHVSRAHVIGASLSHDGTASAIIRDSLTRPPEIWAGLHGQWRQVTHVNDAVEPLWGRAESVNWTSDGFRVQGWLLYPKSVDTTKKAAMVVQVHGGPSSAVTSSWPNLNLAVLAASGYVVFMPNFRGSYGQGEAFTRANVKDFGYGDFRDIVRGVDAAVAKSGTDAGRTGIWGWSYGGYMTMWAVTQTQRFRAAVAGAGLSNWQSYYGQNSIDQWMIPFFGASVYDDPWIYQRSSPITFIKNVKTPTLVVVGDRDGEVPSPQSFEFWHALKSLGTKTQLVVYPNEGHRFVDPQHKRDLAKRLVLWFDGNL